MGDFPYQVDGMFLSHFNEMPIQFLGPKTANFFSQNEGMKNSFYAILLKSRKLTLVLNLRVQLPSQRKRHLWLEILD